jgi:hypothetical protein
VRAILSLILAVVTMSNSLLALVERQLSDASASRAEIAEEDCTHNGRLHAKQWDYVTGPNRFNVVVCSRRAGKTSGTVRKAARMLMGKPGARVCYITLIRRNCRKLFYSPLVDLLHSKGIPCRTNTSDLMIESDNGSFLQCYGCQDSDDIETVLGDKWDLVFIDEAQSFRPGLLEDLVERVIWPSLSDRRGGLDFLGTPPPGGKVGYFWRMFDEGKFERHHWTVFDNPWIPSDEIQQDMEMRGLSPEHPTYRRDYLGEFAVDPDALVYEYKEVWNDIGGPNDVPGGAKIDPTDPAWFFSMGIDLGFSDRDAICVLGWRKNDEKHRLYEAWTWQKNHLHLDELSPIFLGAVRKWRPSRIVGDNGGHGAVKVLKSLEARWGHLPIEFKPSSVHDSVALVNDDLRAGRLLWQPKGILAEDAKLTTWDPKKVGEKIGGGFHSDALPAHRYAHSCACHFIGKVEKPVRTQDEIDYENLKKRKKLREAMLHGRAQYR